MLLMLPGIVLLLRKREGTAWAMVFTSILVLSIVAIYVGGYLYEQSWDAEISLTQYIRGYLNHPSTEWGTLRNFQLHGWKLLLTSQLSSIAVLKGPIDQLGKIVLLLSWLSIFAMVIRDVRQGDRSDVTAQGLLLWVLAQQLLFLWWLPVEREFQIMSLPPFLLLSARSVIQWTRHAAGRLRYAVPVMTVTCVIFLGVVNVPSVVSRHHSAGAWHERAIRLGERLQDVRRFYTDQGTQAVLRLRYHRTDDTQIRVIQQLFSQDRTEDLRQVKSQPATYAIAVTDVPALDMFENIDAGEVRRERYLRWLFDIQDIHEGWLRSRHWRMDGDNAGDPMLYFSASFDTIASIRDVIIALPAHPVLDPLKEEYGCK